MSSKMLLFFFICVMLWCHDVMSWPSQTLILLVDVLESWFFFLFPWFFGSLSSKMLLFFSFAWRYDVMTSCRDVTEPDSPISACRCARNLILFLVSMVIWVTEFKYFTNFSSVWYLDVMTSCPGVTKPDSPIWTCRCARKMIFFCFYDNLVAEFNNVVDFVFFMMT